MSGDPVNPARTRLAFLLETVTLEAQHLQFTDQALCAQAFTTDRAASLRADPQLAERLDAFSARIARLQDTAGDKLLPALLTCLGEGVGSVLDNLDRAARLGLLTQPSEVWIAARALRNRMVHGYICDPALLAEAVTEAHEAVPMLVAFVRACQGYAGAKGLVTPAPAA